MNSPATADPFFSLIYVSSAVRMMTSEDLVALLNTSRRNNTRDDVTGMLLYKEGNFMQVLEGTEDKVRELHDRICQDARHRGLITLLEERHGARLFKEWSMGFRDLSDPAVREVPGYSEFMNVPLNDAAFYGEKSRLHKLLRMFRQSM